MMLLTQFAKTVFIAAAVFLVPQGEARKICARKHHTISNSVFFQRIELPNPVKCIERCIENIDYCRSAVYIQKDPKKQSGFCQLHSVNSDSGTAAQVHPEANLEPVTTVYEILEKCPPSIAPMNNTFMEQIKPELRRILESTKGLKDPEVPQIHTRRPTIRTETVGLSVDEPDILPTKIGVSGDSYVTNPETFGSQRTAVALPSPQANPSPIRPIVSYGHQQQQQQNYYQGRPCPATQGGPCAPKPRCGSPPLSSCVTDEFIHESEVEEIRQIASAVWSEWVTVSECTVTCGAGTLRRQRFCSNDDSSLCQGESQRLEPCDGPPCETWSSWREWSECSATCDRGQRIRVRDCHLARGCSGPAEEREECEEDPCPKWQEWQAWSKCSRSCGNGVQRRKRECDGGGCEGRASEERSCNERTCGEWATWGEWEQCSRPCGGGKKMRIRICKNGVDCRGSSEESISCNNDPCPIWSEWSGWSQCSQTCGEATRLRTRECRRGGTRSTECEGPTQDQGSCGFAPCPVWGEWEEWSPCSVTTRICTGGTACQGGGQEIRFCQEAACPYWSQWADWGGCSVSCGIGFCERSRRCILSENGNEDLFPEGDQVDGALMHHFPESGERSQVNDPTTHHKVNLKQYKLEVSQSETRRAPKRTSSQCVGPETDRKECFAGLCCGWTSWEHWTTCHNGCNQGSKRRTRQCVHERDQPGQGAPPLNDQGTGSLSRTPASVYVGDTPSFSISQVPLQPIRPTVSHSGRRRRRQAQQPFSQYAAAPFLGSTAACDCPGDNEQFETCSDGNCSPSYPQSFSHDGGVSDQFCSWSDWADWSPCIGDCPKAQRQRTRVCRDGDSHKRRPRFPGFQCECPGDLRQSEMCIPSHCRESNDRFLVSRGTEALEDEDVCQWSSWSDWSSCGSDFLKQRTRFCIGQKNLVNNCECIGRALEQTSCTPYADPHNFPVNQTTLEKSRQTLHARLREKQEENCDWNTWSEWGKCSATCGDGERERKRICPCKSCGHDVAREVETCRVLTCYSTGVGNKVKNPFNL
ncbi:hypothetical protein L596_020118 [Steinernema carpocapsae]|uniref:Apple domain-containing protein n=1 Tax=Steinernema carpocapsae TaxID=34508 RepID=A0A4U5MSK6_STECR|nr:hypothetical protein L596_020118 [Steinernema carpocapsae]